MGVGVALGWRMSVFFFTCPAIFLKCHQVTYPLVFTNYLTQSYPLHELTLLCHVELHNLHVFLLIRCFIFPFSLGYWGIKPVSYYPFLLTRIHLLLYPFILFILLSLKCSSWNSAERLNISSRPKSPACTLVSSPCSRQTNLGRWWWCEDDDDGNQQHLPWIIE